MSDAPQESPATAELPDSLVGLIDALVQVADPEPVSMRPETPGWAILAVLALALAIWLSKKGIRYWRATAYRRQALRDLAQVGDNPAKCSEILKRAALVVYPRDTVAALTGHDWLAFLDKTGGRKRFTDGPGRAMAHASFDPEAATESRGLNADARAWLKHQPAKVST